MRMSESDFLFRCYSEPIYRFVYGAEGQECGLYAFLAMARRRRRQRFGRKPRSSPIPPERWISSRPPEVATRQSFGHWEGDLVIFARQFGTANVTSLQERQSRFQILLANTDRRSAGVVGRIAEALAALPPQARRTITFDRGTEFFAYRALELDSYFCDPHSPWQKGGVENANGRVRRHLPLACPAEQRSQPALTDVARRLNDTPRRCLGYRTPAEVFAANVTALAGPAAPVGPQA